MAQRDRSIRISAKDWRAVAQTEGDLLLQIQGDYGDAYRFELRLVPKAGGNTLVIAEPGESLAEQKAANALTA